MKFVFFAERLASHSRFRIGGDVDATTVLVEVDVSVDESEEGVVLAHSDVGSGVPLGATLTDDDVARDYGFTTELFHAEAIAA